ncbi:hypothetical protein DNTS_021907 [Danionella cerebrum]|uniref:Uncharacterized protein n=1 Tax=Danionella cerebrum TaxID=2873325 RepID=A0A553Q1E9_9TELE|nr:hypothetical protein DNTS_021907 [Danionella translucida]
MSLLYGELVGMAFLWLSEYIIRPMLLPTNIESGALLCKTVDEMIEHLRKQRFQMNHENTADGQGNSGALSAQRRDKSITTAGDVLGERKAKTGWFMICDFNSSKAGSSSLGASNGNNKEQCMDFISK